MNWMIPEHMLDIEQRNILDKIATNDKNFWIKGFAGSGKSVLLAYAVKKIRTRSSSSSILLIVFTQSLVEMYKAAFREIGLDINIETYVRFVKGNSYYDYILCDEIQDLTPRIIHEMVNRSKHLIVAGDSNQSIYKYDPLWKEPTVTPAEIGKLINGETVELGIIHRLSRSIIDAVQRLLPRMNIFSAKRDMTKKDTQIRLCEAPSDIEEVSYVMDNATEAVNTGYTTAILIPSAEKIIQFVNQVLCNAGKATWNEKPNHYGKTDFGDMNSYLQKNGIKMQYVGNGYGSFSENDHRVTIMTFHSAKGLDFDKVFIPYTNRNMYINSDQSLSKILFMVAMTRTKSDLYISYTGYPSDLLDSFKSNCAHIDISANADSNQTLNNDNPFGF